MAASVQHRARVALAFVGLLAMPVRIVIAQESMARAFDLERRGAYTQAAQVYREVLHTRPGDVAAMLGLERALTPINRFPDILPDLRAALAAAPGAIPLYGIGLRAYAAAGLLDSLPPLVDRWARAAPGDETPFREWAGAALQARDRATARRAYQLARERLGRPEALAAEIAQLAVADQDWDTAVREWIRAMRQLPGYRSSAAATLGGAPEPARAGILEALGREPDPEATRIAVDLRARWGDPLGAFELLQHALPAAPAQQVEALRAFLEYARTQSTPPYLQAQARTLEALADRWNVPAQRARYGLEAARAYVGAGDTAAARRMLTRVAGDTSGGAAVAAGATATLIDLLLREGNLEEASRRLAHGGTTLPVDEYLRLRRLVALRWAQQGDVPRADSVMAADSSVEAIVLRGRFRLYQGDLKSASDCWREAGPFAGTREEATERTAILAMLQPIQDDTMLALGEAFRLADRGDTVAAARAFEATAMELPADGGRAEALVHSGRLFAVTGAADEAERVFHVAVDANAPGASAAALLELGRLLLATDRRDAAVAELEKLILEYPKSALLPQARRLLDQARQAVPRT